ncbi:glycosyl hydrolase family 28-related protein [Peribacillus frigoritolerans]|uniref:glycosyl hydrolase family 28-related protein n=1 Tax=Peribacillus frigoritolerans TaxID=450367 RepID=UPI0007BEBF8C|nr:glycosyl hydrolase family 28-related protein [Peribacillus frigoritolerans]
MKRRKFILLIFIIILILITNYIFRFKLKGINIKWFGAKGDGISNDTKAFIDAINIVHKLGGGKIIIPRGNYKVTGGEIFLKSNVYLKGIGLPRIFTNSGNGYFSIISKKLEDTVEDVTISGIFFDQWDELSSDIQPNNNQIPCNCITLLGKSRNIIIMDNLFQAFGGWVISVSDQEDYYGSERVFLKRNKIRWQLKGKTWYDASPIYVEATNHEIENNEIEAFKVKIDPPARWKLEGGIETHGFGIVRGNVIKNAQAGINVVPPKYNPGAYLKMGYRDISDNTLRGVNRGIWFWPINYNNGLEKIKIFNNDIEVVAEGYYAGHGGIVTVMQETPFINASMNGPIKNVEIYNNQIKFVDNGYTGKEYFHLNNVGAIHFGANNKVSNVNVYNNHIVNFPWCAVDTVQYEFDYVRMHDNFNIFNNTIIDCGYGMSNDFQKSVFYFSDINNVSVNNNTIKWINQKGTKYLITAGKVTTLLVFQNNRQISENGFYLSTSNVVNTNKIQ